MIPTAEEFLNLKGVPYREGIKNHLGNYISPNELIEFAKLHVEQALKAASENAETKACWYTDHDEEVDKDSILNAYPLNLIN
jgi:hypothetical protein